MQDLIVFAIYVGGFIGILALAALCEELYYKWLSK